MSQSIEAELVQLFKSYDDLCEQRQELENKLDEAEDTNLPWASAYTVVVHSSQVTISIIVRNNLYYSAMLYPSTLHVI